ncbi:hypothetical protein [Candidatus Magnetobacterium casense]|uniref:Uncharacterized protein n=1 Tax=Candidatus Magnetobacterium casense TaxID=1455061 RepID=A0ABS6RWS0_9BACT|nr:hypothetical protein [Candidatus Magnetobacterium casensis]MBV6341084.1 hypothetical protein [Candidatus Magnetobacterium casensis]
MPGTNPYIPDFPYNDPEIGHQWDAEGNKTTMYGKDLYCNRNSPNYDPVLCSAAGGTPYGRSYGSKGSQGQGEGSAKSGLGDWWDSLPGLSEKPKNKYEEILNVLRDRFVQDPFQQATAASTNSPMASALWDTVYGKGVPRYENVMSEIAKMVMPTWEGNNYIPQSPFDANRFSSLSQLAQMLQQNRQGYASALNSGYGSGLGASTSMIQGAGNQLQGYRGQDQDRYLKEKQMQHEMEMLILQLQAQAAAQGGGGGLFDILGGLLGIGGSGGLDWLWKLLKSGGSGGSGGGMNYNPGFLGGGY